MNHRITLSDTEQALISQYRLLPVECQEMALKLVLGYVAKHVPWAPTTASKNGGA